VIGTDAPTAAHFSTAIAAISRFMSTYALLVLLVLLIAIFSLVLPDTFPTVFNARTIVSDKSTIALLALALMIPLAANQFDLSVGFTLGLTSVLAVGFQIHTTAGTATVWHPEMPWPLAIFAILLVGGIVGLVNGILVTWARIDSFIATLGMGTLLLGVTYWYSGGVQVYGDLSVAFTNITDASPLGIPAPAIIVFIIAIVMWIVFEYLPIGRFLYAIGASPRAAELSGIPSRRYILLAFVASGLIAGADGVLLASKLRVGASNVGPDFLLPAFVGAMLGASSVKPGRVNVWGTILAVMVLAVGVSGLAQLGASFYINPLFNGATLIVAVGVAGYAARRRVFRASTRDRAEQMGRRPKDAGRELEGE
jgi:ribose transport system permease protein